MKKKYIQPTLREHKLHLNVYLQGFSDVEGNAASGNGANTSGSYNPSGDTPNKPIEAKVNFFSDWDE